MTTKLKKVERKFKVEICKSCDGSGSIWSHTPDQVIETTCPNCQGRGKITVERPPQKKRVKIDEKTKFNAISRDANTMPNEFTGNWS